MFLAVRIATHRLIAPAAFVVLAAEDDLHGLLERVADLIRPDCQLRHLPHSVRDKSRGFGSPELPEQLERLAKQAALAAAAAAEAARVAAELELDQRFVTGAVADLEVDRPSSVVYLAIHIEVASAPDEAEGDLHGGLLIQAEWRAKCRR